MCGVKGLSNDRLKIIAVFAMTIDHIGAYLLPHITVLRIIGRIAFPIFAFMIAEGCVHTGNKKRYLINMASLAAVCQLLFYRFDTHIFLRIPCTFTLSIIIVYTMQHMFRVCSSEASVLKKISAVLLLVAVVYAVYELNGKVTIDYGFYGCVTPALVSCISEADKTKANIVAKVGMLAYALILISGQSIYLQYFSLLAIPLLVMYNGKRENIIPKNFFYIYYPLHLAVIYAVKYLFL